MAYTCEDCVFMGTEEVLRLSTDKFKTYYEKLDFCYEQPLKIERKKESPACKLLSLKVD